MANLELTDSQAVDLARHFLGAWWTASSTPRGIKVLDGGRGSFVGTSWRDAFRMAGVKLPARPRFVQVGRRVMLGRNPIRVCESNSQALRVTRKLNREAYSASD